MNYNSYLVDLVQRTTFDIETPCTTYMFQILSLSVLKPWKLARCTFIQTQSKSKSVGKMESYKWSRFLSSGVQLSS
jgi:hypothetical protein